jgi:uncharacterized protein YjiS (DUF1127 family)
MRRAQNRRPIGGWSGVVIAPLLSWATIRAVWRRYRTRQRIAEPDNHMLKDIGVNFAEAEAPTSRSGGSRTTSTT